MIELVLVFLMIRCTIVFTPGRDQSRGSTDQSRGRSLACAQATNTVCDHAPYGARKIVGWMPTALSASLAREICERTADSESLDWSAWFQVWFTIVCPAAATSLTSERFAAICSPIMQKVALIRYWSSRSRICGVYCAFGPSSSVSAITFGPALT